MTLASILSSFLPVAYADAPPEKEVEQPKEESDDAAKSESKDSDDSENNEESESDEGKDDGEEQEEEEEKEVVDPALEIREECKEAKQCAPLTKHFLHCQDKVESGKGFEHETCIEEFMMHCVDNCVAPKLFSKLV